MIDVIEWISILSPTICLITYVYCVKKISLSFIIYLPILAVLSLVLDIVTYKWAVIEKPNYLFGTLYFLLTLVITLLLYYKMLAKNMMVVKNIFIGLAISLIFTSWIFWEGWEISQNIGWVIAQIACCSLALAHYAHMIADRPVYRVTKYAPYWITTGILIYSCTSFSVIAFIRAFSEILEVLEARNLWMVHNLANITKNVCFALAIWWAAHRNTEWDKMKWWE